jgi:asparagine synthase (glutamine-hydrolysing)
MLRRIDHRGPDGSGDLVTDEAWLGHVRLSIVDLEGGGQPISTRDGRMHMVANGEIYNHEQLREELGHEHFSTRSDSEVALQLVALRGPEALADLWGMFALAIAGEDGTFVAARDAVGIKPLYWARRDGETRFASELIAFDEDWQEDVELFPPGYMWTPEDGLVRIQSAVPEDDRPRFAPPADEDEPTPPELLQAVRETLITAVRRRMMADVRIGVFLSGGLDSSVIAAIAAREAADRGYVLPTFAVGTEGSSDLKAARFVAEYLGTEHHERIVTPEEARAHLPVAVRSIESFDPSLVRSAVPNYMLSALAAKHVKVVLTGEGADELFAGYDYVERFKTEEELHDELVRTVENLHGLNLQRCDRVTMAHGLEGRVPFLDLDMIALSLAIPAGWKLPLPHRQEKLVLREAFEGWVPDEILYRKKEQFGDGSGAADVLQADGVVEEEVYKAIFEEHLPGIDPEQTLTRFATA